MTNQQPRVRDLLMFKKRNVRPPPSRRKVSEEDESVVVTGIDAAADEETIEYAQILYIPHAS